MAVALLTIGMAGILGLFRVSATASGYSRRATEAAILAEDKLEYLRTVPIAAVADGTDTVDAAGVLADEGFTRVWTLAPSGDLVSISVAVSWNEGDGLHTTTFRTVRNL